LLTNYRVNAICLVSRETLCKRKPLQVCEHVSARISRLLKKRTQYFNIEPMRNSGGPSSLPEAGGKSAKQLADD
jgi:hypothetical protein